MRCSACSHALDPADRFCRSCGSAAAPVESGPSLQVRERAHREEERKLVTVLFADLIGSTTLAERLDPEDLRTVLASFFGALATCIRDYGGTVDKYIGDAVMAVFGAPAAHEDDPQRALRAALAMQKALTGLNDELEHGRGARLALRVGVNTGEVVAGFLASAVQSAYTVVGDTVNTAQRLESAAEPGAIYVGALTHRLASRHFDFEGLGTIHLKGKAEPLLAFRLIGPRTPASGADRIMIGSELVGRQAELAVLNERIADVAIGRGGLVLVTGEAGMGKSRLVTEARRRAGAEVIWGEGRAVSIGAAISYLPFIELTKRDAGISDDDDEPTSRAKLESRVADLFPGDVNEVLPYLSTLVGLEVKGELAERVRYQDAAAMGMRIFAVARRYVARLTEYLPLVLLFEDWHWVDQSSAALLEHLVPLVSNDPLLVIVTSRPEGPSLAGLRRLGAGLDPDRYREIALAPLPPTESDELLRNLLSSGDVPARVRALVEDKTDGNPFFVEEVVRAIIDLGGIVRDSPDAPWQATGRLDEITIPDTLQGVIAARIDRLDEEVKQILKLAAVIGRIFVFRVLRSLADPSVALERDLTELQGLDLIRERRRIPELEYVFKHALVHEATYESILLRRRRELHQLVGEAIERLFSDRLEEFYGFLAYHFARAEEWKKAQDYLFKAGDRAAKIAGDAEALEQYRDALAAYTRAFGDRWDPVQRASLERKMGEALFRRGEHPEARSYLESALALVGIRYPRTPAGVRWSIVRQLLLQMGHRRAPALFLRRRDRSAPEEPIRALELLGWMDYFGDPERLVLDALLGLNVAEESGYAPGIVHGSVGLGLICDAVPLHGVARGYYEAAVRLAESLGPPEVGNAQQMIGYHHHHALGDLAAGERHYRRSAEAYEAAGDIRRWASPAMLWAHLLRFRGDYAQSRAMSEKVAKAGEEGADDQLRVWGWRELGSTLVHQGELDAAAAVIQRANELARRVPDYMSLASGAGYLGECYLGQGRLDEALAILHDGARIIEERRLRTFYATQVRITLAHASLVAIEYGGSDVRAAERAVKAALGQGKFDREAVPAAQRWRGTLEWLRGDRVAATEWWERSRALAEHMGGRYDLAITLREIGRHLGDDEATARSRAIFGEIGARLYLEREETAVSV